MPELPEVEQFKQFLGATSLYQPIQNIIVTHTLVLDRISPSTLHTLLRGKEFEAVIRHGKYVFAQIRDLWLTFHFGMSGYLLYLHHTDEAPLHGRVSFQFSNGNSLIFTCQRMFGRVGLTTSIPSFLQEKHLGLDALEIDFETFTHQFSHRRGILKTALMDQHLLAGIGNLYADEIMFQTGLHPLTTIPSLSKAHLRAIFDAMKDILSTAIAADADFNRYPSTYLLPHRTKGGTCPWDHAPLQQLKLGGRTAYFCPKHQPP